MAKRLRARDKLLFAAAVLGDLYFEVMEPVSLQIKKMKGFLPSDYKATNFASTVSRMLRTGYMEKVIKNGEPYLRLTSKGEKALVRDFSFFAMRQKKWDGLWRIVFYDIPEKNRIAREKLQSKLCELGFGMIQESVYISPFDVAEDLREFLENWHLGDFVFVSVSKQLLAGNQKILAEKIWKLEKLNKKYLELYQKIKEGEKADKILAEYEGILREDPCLPKELLSEEWIGEKLYREIKNLLQQAA